MKIIRLTVALLALGMAVGPSVLPAQTPIPVCPKCGTSRK
jgi:hypothetical protein